MILAIDPGIRGTGAALFERSGAPPEGNSFRLASDPPHYVLRRASYVKNLAHKGNMAGEACVMGAEVFKWLWANERAQISAIAVEWPRVYATKIRQGETDGQDPNDLIALSAVDAAVAASLAKPVHSYYPSDWKGQMKKEACQYRIRGRLSGEEMVILTAGLKEAGAKGHNIWDAVGIGLHHLGRFKPMRVIPT